MDYTLAKKMKELGFAQKRHDKAKYYIDDNAIAYFEDIKNAFSATIYHTTGKEEPVDWNVHFTYIPELIDFIGPKQLDITIDSASKQWIDGRDAQDPLELIRRTENAINENKVKEA